MGLAEGDHPLREAVNGRHAVRGAPSRARSSRCPGCTGLLLPPWVCRNSSPAANIGMPLASSSRQKKFFACRWRRAITSAGTPSSPSQPQFQLRFSAVPSVLPWPLAPVVLLVVGDDVVEREAVVAGDVVDALERPVGIAGVVGEEVVAAVEPEHERPDHPGIAADEPADVVAEPAVPLVPQRPGELGPELVGPAGIPGLGDQVDVAQDRVGADGGQERVVGRRERAVGAAGQHGGEVEPEAVDVHLRDPVAQAVEDQRPGADAGDRPACCRSRCSRGTSPAGRRTSRRRRRCRSPES